MGERDVVTVAIRWFGCVIHGPSFTRCSNFTKAMAEQQNRATEIEKSKITAANAELLGCNSGWSRYLDWHIGVWCAAPETLDAIGPKLCEAGSGAGGGFHAHISSPNKRVSSAGSIWAAGVGGLGVEFHMNFDWQFFNESIVSLLDYCSDSSRVICTENSCDESDTIRLFV